MEVFRKAKSLFTVSMLERRLHVLQETMSNQKIFGRVKELSGANHGNLRIYKGIHR
jgi:hypothetical protein